MAIEILMPALSPTMEEGTLAKWLVKKGDAVGPGDVIAEIETDKATMEVEAVDEGTIGEILVAEGTEAVKVNAPIATLIGEDGDTEMTSAAVPQENTHAASEVEETPSTTAATESVAVAVADECGGSLVSKLTQ